MDAARLAHFQSAVTGARAVAKRAEEAANECARIRALALADIQRTEWMNKTVTDEQRAALAKAEAEFAQACAERNAAHAAVTSAGETLNACLAYVRTK
jgi:hypothetical protein